MSQHLISTNNENSSSIQNVKCEITCLQKRFLGKKKGTQHEFWMTMLQITTIKHSNNYNEFTHQVEGSERH